MFAAAVRSVAWLLCLGVGLLIRHALELAGYCLLHSFQRCHSTGGFHSEAALLARINGVWPPAREEITSFQRTKERQEDRCSLNINYVRHIIQGTAPVCVEKRMQPSPTGKGKKCCTVHGLTRKIHNVQPNLQSPILSAACVD
uniref:Secreted protein n=1 Tax=Saimiri boliviensis boliviensis TaxID=39432 RepID=A0A2K6TXT5_SAIBB